ncbi:hypothetical protein [Butyrivibrio sp. MC2021]|uniref:hypothetical protein n=1 Tax=Butyrivibrio sp. MC2021 TaxID=1408306 RepID=UPI000479FFAE|nr:hypothetical protein [Butyrivibrio sp. MC2021]
MMNKRFLTKVFAFAVSACFALQPVTALAAETSGNEITMETRTRGRTVLDEILATTNMSECIALDQPYTDPKFNSNYDLLSFWGGALYKK